MERFVNCPHCDLLIEIDQINCGIFRCGIYKNSYFQIPPHSTREECDRLKINNLIHGCGKPFKIITYNSEPLEPPATKIIIEPCEYI